MAARKKKTAAAASPVPRRRQAALAFDALTVEGGLLSPEWLARVAQLAATRQTESDYRIPKGLNLRDEIGRYWRVAQALWNDLHTGLAGNAEPGPLAERFVTALLRDCFGFASLTTSPPVVLDDRSFPIGHAALAGRVPVVIAPAGAGLDTRFAELGDSGRSRSAFGLAQEYLNAAESAHWGLVSDGLRLRLLRDNASLTRPAWIEADLSRIFSEQLYPDFTALWLLAHESRYGAPDAAPTDSPLETWRIAGREEGTRAREHLRSGVEQAVLALGQGFLSHPDNSALRKALEDGSLRDRAYFQELLRVVYRMIFLLTAEERGLLHPDSATDPAKARYATGYALRRLRERSIRRSAHDRFHDLWESLAIVFRGLASGESALGLPALAGLFAADQCPTLDGAKLENHRLLTAIFKLAWLKEDGGLARVNWRDMGPEELGSVYESLLELVPRITENGRLFSFATGAETKGNARKTTGSYYTPDSLVQVLLDSALEPVVTETIAKHPENPVEALLSLTIVDPACGSGHFLLAAARRLAAHVARLHAKGTPSAADYRHALRQVVGHCIFGVDLNPMAVELCKVSLWMEAVEPGLPLSFLDSHIQHGNSLLGTTPELMAAGIPDAAWDPIEGDDKKIASLLKKRNKQSAGGQRGLDSLWSKPPETEVDEVRKAVSELDAAPDNDTAALASKETLWEQILDSPAYRHQRFVADAWCAAFVWPKESGPLTDAAPTNSLWLQIRDSQGHPPAATRTTVEELAARHHFFHWHLAFPQVTGRGGFDIVLGNPPWERVKLQEQEFFASRSDEISEAANSAARKKLISALEESDPKLWDEWTNASREAEGTSHFVRTSGRFPLCGRGDINTYALFSERNAALTSKRGRAGFIVPTGLITDESTSEFLRMLVEARRLVRAFDFENTAKEAFFPGVGHRRFKFSLVTVAGTPMAHGHEPEFIFYADDIASLSDASRRFRLSPEDFALFNPASRTCPAFRTGRDAELAKRLYRQMSILRSPDIDPWETRFVTMFHMAGDSPLFRSRESFASPRYRFTGNEVVGPDGRFVSLFEAKMIHLFDHRYGDYADQPEDSENSSLPDIPADRMDDRLYEVTPRYWVHRDLADEALQRVEWQQSWFFAWRDIARAGDERTAILSAMPRVACGHTLPVLLIGTKTGEPRRLAHCFQALVSSLLFDYVTRLKNGGTHLTFGLVEQLPVFAPRKFLEPLENLGTTADQFIRPRVLELAYTTNSLSEYAKDLGHIGLPFQWNPLRRASIRAELDALVFMMARFDRSEVEYVVDGFNRLRLNETSAFGEFRTKKRLLDAYDRLRSASRTRPFESLVNPLPADASVAHQPRSLPVPTVPLRVPVYAKYNDEEDGARFVWAALFAAGGTIPLLDLASAFALRSHPDLLLELAMKHAKTDSRQAAKEWRTRVPSRNVKSGFLAGLLTALAKRDAVKRRNEKSRAIVAAGPTTPAAEKIGDWYFFEARLLLEILRALPEDAARVVDDRIEGEDRKLLKVSKA